MPPSNMEQAIFILVNDELKNCVTGPIESYGVECLSSVDILKVSACGVVS